MNMNKAFVRRVIRYSFNKGIGKLIPWIVVLYVLLLAETVVSTIYFINHG